jgi:signal transduction histidine kinase/HAMP domain-containing protein
MNRWSFVSGLTVILLLLLVLSGFCVWATRGLTDEMGTIINQNYDSIRALRELRSALTRINAQCLALPDDTSITSKSAVFRRERDVAEKRLGQVERNAASPAEREMVQRLTGIGQSYFAAYDELFALKPAAAERRDDLNRIISGLTGDIGTVADQIVTLNENAIMGRRDNAVLKGRRVTFIAMGFAIFSLGVYILTSMRLTRAVFAPLRQLRDSIQLVSARRFDTVVPISGTGEELGQIAAGFNEMALELQRYIGETDERAVAANRISRAILEALPYPVYIVDRDFAVRQANPRAEALSLALGIPGVLPGEVRRQIDAAAAEARDVVGDDLRRAVRLVPATAGGAEGGDYLPQIFRMTGAFGGEDGWAVLLVDITRLRRNDEAKTKALATLSHEVKTPVTGIRMSLHLLLEEKLGAINPDQRELLEIGRDDCERLLVVLQALLELARLESGRVALQPVPTAPAELLNEAVTAFGDGVRRAGSEIIVELANHLPPVLADAVHANRVLGNFLTNAGKYGLRGRPVVLRAQPRGDGYVRFTVVNHGRPFTEAEQAQVFDPFFRRSNENAEGAGLGLAICREIATLHGGRVGVYSPADSDLVEFFLDLRRAG